MSPYRPDYLFQTVADVLGGHPSISKAAGLKATSHLTISMRGMRAKSKIQRNYYQNLQCGPTFAGKSSSVPLIAPMHAQTIAE